MEDKDIEIVESFKMLSKNIVNFFENNLFKSSNIGCSEMNALVVICENKKVNQKMNVTELATKLKITKSAASQIVTKLEKKGYIKRKRNLFDKKINYISLNENVLQQYEDKHKEYSQMAHKVSEQMGEHDVKELTRLLEKLSNIINNLGKDDCTC